MDSPEPESPRRTGLRRIRLPHLPGQASDSSCRRRCPQHFHGNRRGGQGDSARSADRPDACADRGQACRRVGGHGHSHAAAMAVKPADHMPTTNSCQSCHTSIAWTPVRTVDHTQVIGSCVSCHNGKSCIRQASAAHRKQQCLRELPHDERLDARAIRSCGRDRPRLHHVPQLVAGDRYAAQSHSDHRSSATRATGPLRGCRQNWTTRPSVATASLATTTPTPSGSPPATWSCSATARCATRTRTGARSPLSGTHPRLIRETISGAELRRLSYDQHGPGAVPLRRRRRQLRRLPREGLQAGRSSEDRERCPLQHY